VPVFAEGELAFIVAVRSHLPDGTGGGARPGGVFPAATEVFEEGIRYPPIKLSEGGQLLQDRLDWVVRNCRFKEWTLGDIRAMMASCSVAQARIQDLVRRYGLATVVEATDYALDYAERLFRAEVESWPDGTYEGVAYMDSDGYYTWDIGIRARVTIEGDHLVIDFTGTDPETKGFANSAAGNTLSYVFLALSCLLDESIPKNDGIFRPVRVVLPSGIVLNPIDGAPTGYCTLHPGAEVAQAVTLAIAQAIPEKAGTPWDTRVSSIISGVDPRHGSRYVALPFISIHGGPGGTAGLDGWGGGSCMRGGMAYITAEMHESQYPHRVDEREFIQDSGGPGKWRGGCGVRTTLKVVDHSALAGVMVWGGRYPSPAMCGGLSGLPNKAEFIYPDRPQEELQGGESLERSLRSGDGVRITRGGGGGWGDPLERDPELVREDVLDGYVSLDGARRDYGVVIDPETLELDWKSTEGLRRTLRSQAPAPASV
jgi:N-methylhydantoinase B